jgi:hypothetical protein
MNSRCKKCKKEIKSMQAYTVRFVYDKNGKEKKIGVYHWECAK